MSDSSSDQTSHGFPTIAVRCSACGSVIAHLTPSGDSHRLIMPDEPFLMYPKRGLMMCPDCGHLEKVDGVLGGAPPISETLQNAPLSGADSEGPFKLESACSVTFQNAVTCPAHLQAAFLGFKANMVRLHNLAELAPLCAGLTTLLHSYTSEVGTHAQDISAVAQWKEVHLKSVRLCRSPLSPKIREEATKVGLVSMSYWLLRHHTDLSPAVSALLSAQLISAWTAFEVLAKDLWTAMVAHSSPKLGSRALQAAPFRDDRAEASLEQNPASQEAVPKPKAVVEFFKSLVAQNALVPERVAEMLANERKFNFNRYEGIVHAYKSVFGGTLAQAIFQSPSAKQVRVLELLRNVLVHRAGIADAFFIEQLREAKSPCSSWLSIPCAGEEIPLNGEIVSRFVSSVWQTGAALIAELASTSST